MIRVEITEYARYNFRIGDIFYNKYEIIQPPIYLLFFSLILSHYNKIMSGKVDRRKINLIMHCIIQKNVQHGTKYEDVENTCQLNV